MTPKLYVVDAHAYVQFATGDPGLGRTARSILADLGNRFVLPVIAFAEICWLIDKGRTSIPSVSTLVSDLSHDPRFSVYALDPDVVLRAHAIAYPFEMHDGQIVATALLLIDAGYDVDILTADAEITRSGLVTVVW